MLRMCLTCALALTSCARAKTLDDESSFDCSVTCCDYSLLKECLLSVGEFPICEQISNCKAEETK